MPRHPDVDGRLSLPPNLVGRQQAIEACRSADPERVHIFDVENHEGTPVYVHAKVCVIDDVWATVGSDNLNRRSWTHDSELSCAVLDDTGEFARDLRLRLIREHLDRAADGSEDDGIGRPRHRRGDRGVGQRAGGMACQGGKGRSAAWPASSTPAGESRPADPVVGRSGVPGVL